MTGTHVVEECPELDQWRPRRAVRKDWRKAPEGRAVSKKKEKEEEEEDLLGAFFYRIYEFFFTFSNPPPVIHRPHVPERYAIKFVPAAAGSALPPAFSTVSPVSTYASLPVLSSPVSTDYSVISSANFVCVTSASSFPAFTTPCIDTTQ